MKAKKRKIKSEQNWYFSFGSGQVHNGRYVKYFGTQGETRDKMFDAFGQKWCMQYSEEQWNNPREGFHRGKTLAEVWGWKEIK